MSKKLSTVRVFVLGFIVITILALLGSNENSWGRIVFGSTQTLLSGEESSKTARVASEQRAGDRTSVDESADVSSGKIDFKRGFRGAAAPSFLELDYRFPTLNAAETADNSPTASSGPIIFQRGFFAASDVPFNRGGQLFKVDPNTQVETFFGDGSQPNYSLDGSKLVFLLNSHIATSPANGYAPTELTNSGGGSPIIGLYPKWSPEGGHIAYNATKNINGALVYHIKVIGGTCAACDITQELNPSGTSAYLYPAWYPAGTTSGGSTSYQLVFVRTSAVKADVDAGNYTGDIFTELITIAANGTVTEGTRTNLTNSPATYAFPVYSFDGTKLLFVKRNQDGSSSLNLQDASVPNPPPPVTIFSYPAGNQIIQHPAWSPDIFGSSRIVFGDAYQLFKTGPLGGNTTPVTTSANAAADLWPSWAPAPPVNLQVNLTDTPDPVVADSTLTYTVTVTNNGQSTAPIVKGNVAIPDDALFIASGTSSGCVRIGTTRNVECSFGNIVAGDSSAKQITVRPTGGSTPLTFNISVTNGSDASTITAVETTTVTAGSRPPNDNFISCSAVPPSPNCPLTVTGPIPLTGMSGTINGSNVGATREIPINYGLGRIEPYEVNHANVNGGKSVWYYWTPPANSTGAMAIDTSGSNFDTLLAVYSQGIGPTDFSLRKELASNNDISEFNPTSTSPTASQVFFQFDSQHVYYIVVDGKQGATGNIKLNWRAIMPGTPPTQVAQSISIGIFPSIVCTVGSSASDICDGYFDPSGYFVIRIKGRNFTSDSQVMIGGFSVTNLHGFDRAGNPINGQLSLSVSPTGVTELQARIPPNPPLTNVALESVRVVTRRASPANITDAPVGEASPTDSFLTGLADGDYDTSFGSRGLLAFEAQKVVIPPGGTKEVCFEVGSATDEYCIEWHNTGSTPATFLPTFFAEYTKCLGPKYNTPKLSEECTTATRKNSQFAINPQGLFGGTCKWRKRVNIPASVLQTIQSSNGQIAVGVEAGKTVVGIVPSAGGELISNDGGGLISNDGGGVISNDGASLITNDGGGLISKKGGGLITNDGGGVISNDGASFKVINTLITNDGGGRPEHLLIDVLVGKYSGSKLASDERLAPASSAAATSSGVGGLLLAQSSGGQDPVFTTETDPVTGEVKGYITITLDDTSFPRVSDLRGLAFSVLVNPAIVQFASNNLTVNKADGSATATITRTGDKSAEMTVEYKTQDDTANDRTDYSPVFGSVTFASGETTKQVTVPIIKHGYGTPDFGAQRKFNLVIVNVTGGSLQVPNFATITITNNDAANLTTNPLDNADAQFFVRQQYLDLLGREPTANELSTGAAPITQCGSDQACVRTKRTDLSYSLFLQYQQAAAYVFRVYRAAYGNNQPFPNPDVSNLVEAKKWPAYFAFFRDRVSIGEGLNVPPTQLALANAFVLRPEFVQKYPTLTLPDGPTFVDAVLATIKNDSGVDLASQRAALILVFDQAGGFTSGRGAVIYRLAEDAQTNPINNAAFINAEYNRAFAATMFFGYIRTDGTVAALNLRKGQLDAAPLRDATAQKGLTNAFITSPEFRTRFGLSGPATNLTVGGRALTPDARGLKSARVTFTDSHGVSRFVLTNAFGVYSITGLTGDSYTVRVSSKSYRFTPQNLVIATDLTLADFIGVE